MWEVITALTGAILLLSSSKVTRVGGASLASITIINFLGGFDYLQTLTNGIIYLQITGMALYAMPLTVVNKYMPLSTREWITVLCFFCLMTLDGVYLIDYGEGIIDLAGYKDVLINLICFSTLIVVNIQKGAQNGSLILSGVFRLFISMCNNILLRAKVNQLLVKQKGDSEIISQKIEGKACQLKL